MSSSRELSSSFTLIERPIKTTQHLTTSEVKRTSSILLWTAAVGLGIPCIAMAL